MVCGGEVFEEGGDVEGGSILVTTVVGEGRVVVDVTVGTVVVVPGFAVVEVVVAGAVVVVLFIPANIRNSSSLSGV